MVKISGLIEAKELCCSYGDVWSHGPGALSKPWVTYIRDVYLVGKKKLESGSLSK